MTEKIRLICGVCGGTITTDPADDKRARDDGAFLFPKTPRENMVPVCNICWPAIAARITARANIQ